MQEGSCVRPVSMGGNARDAKHFRRLFDRHAAEVSQGNESRLDGVLLFQFLQSFVQRDQFLGSHAGWQASDFDINPLQLAAVLDSLLSTGVFHQDAAHGLGRGGEEVAATVPVLGGRPRPPAGRRPRGPGPSPVESDPVSLGPTVPPRACATRR